MTTPLERLLAAARAVIYDAGWVGIGDDDTQHQYQFDLARSVADLRDAVAAYEAAAATPTKSIDELIAASSLGQPYAEPDEDELERAMDALAEIEAATPKGGSER